MRIAITEMLWLDRHEEISLTELAEVSGLNAAEIDELVSAGIIAPIDDTQSPKKFSADSLVAARAAFRLRRDFELNAPGVTLAMTLLDQIHDLESQLRELRALLPRTIR
jgi:chaperone modulatory protein CbpM